ncbi:UDP-N-acetylmuramoyl-L-alanine--D-glutamate ligase [Candidatus Erwinia haradaeae]|uniref:UDP-N-acetylmuramoyl-L-alanine--D-glutamate ligase n=1 Tax=Candidatus Erwinia haradaeae TaxID=1922217 RepID=UPI0009354772|nr:UDP-N-acetylmuramoyl-L-alanine--D-glutamate ligase [Candidatus Erwinia haradaeae]
MNNYTGTKVVIIGLGLTGSACVDFFLTRGVIPRVIDTRIKPPLLYSLPENVEYWLGEINHSWLMNSDLIIISPGISPLQPSLMMAAHAGIEIISEIELFCRETQTPIVAITGSNGKSTVTSWLGGMARSMGWMVGIGGNIGVPALRLLNQPAQLYILELSSFQLETTYSLQAVAATILNVSEDHMDRYPLGMQQYCSAKLRIYKNATLCLVNADDANTIPVWNAHACYRSFGVYTGDYHFKNQNNSTWLQALGESVLNINEMRITGKHNFTNALSVLALADALHIPRGISLSSLTSFTGLEHRFQIIHQKNGVQWINDSKSTNVGSTTAALHNLEPDGTLWLLLGGDSKSADLTPLSEPLQKKDLRLYCFGRDRDKFAKLRPEITVQTETMIEAMLEIASKVQPGDIVLLAPACSSLDQFTNFEERGALFTKIAREVG